MCRGYFGYPQHHNSSSFAAVEGYEFLCVKETRNGKKPGAWWSCQPDISGWWTLTVRTRATTWDSNFRNKINFPDLSRLSTSRFPPLSTSFVSNLLPTQLHINFSWGAPHQCEGGGNTSAEATARSAVWWMRPVILDISGCCQVEDIHYTEICKILHQSWIEIYIITWIHDDSWFIPPELQVHKSQAWEMQVPLFYALTYVRNHHRGIRSCFSEHRMTTRGAWCGLAYWVFGWSLEDDPWKSLGSCAHAKWRNGTV